MVYILVGYLLEFLCKAGYYTLPLYFLVSIFFLILIKKYFKYKVFNLEKRIYRNKDKGKEIDKKLRLIKLFNYILNYLNLFDITLKNIVKVIIIFIISYLYIFTFLNFIDSLYNKDLNLQKNEFENIYYFEKRVSKKSKKTKKANVNDNKKFSKKSEKTFNKSLDDLDKLNKLDVHSNSINVSNINNVKNIKFTDKSKANLYNKKVLKNKYKVQKRIETGSGRYTLYLLDKRKREKLFIYTGILISANNENISYSTNALFKKILVSFTSKKEYYLKNQYYMNGRLELFDKARNYNGFDLRDFNYSRNLYFNIKAHNDEIKKVKITLNPIIVNYENLIIDLKKDFHDKVSKDKNSGLLSGIVLGDVDNISEEKKQVYKDVNVYHLLAVSGSHATYILVIVGFLTNFFKFGKIVRILFTSISMIVFMSIVGFSSSIFRVGLIVLLRCLFDLINKKPSYFMLIIVSYFLIIIYNPYKILDIGIYLSYGGMFAIIFINNLISDNYIFERIILKLKLISKEEFKSKIKKVDIHVMENLTGSKNENSSEFGDLFYTESKNFIFKIRVIFLNLFKMLFDIVITTLSVQILIWPILAISFNTINFNFLISNILAIPILGYATILGFIVLFFGKFFPIFNFIFSALIYASSLLISLADSLISWSHNFGGSTYIKDLKPLFLILYSYLCFFILYILKILTDKGIFKLSLNYFSIIKNSKKIFNNELVRLVIYKVVILVVIIIVYTYIIFLDFRSSSSVHFADIGQGDASIIKTKSGKNIIIDTGEGMSMKYPAGAKMFFPLLLKRNITTVDYLIISHFDSDHCGGSEIILKNLKVKNLVISKNYTINKNFKKIIKLATVKNVNIIKAKKGMTLNVSKELKLLFIWPGIKKIKKNEMNNNALVFIAKFKNGFTVLYTGDIEKIAEQKAFQDLKKIRVNVLKAPHHGSVTSSTKYILSKIICNEVVISVSKTNSFGHPSDIILDRYKSLNYNIRRTDKEGEISYYLND